MNQSKRITSFISSQGDKKSIDKLMVERMKLEEESKSANLLKKISINSKIEEVDKEIKDKISKS